MNPVNNPSGGRNPRRVFIYSQVIMFWQQVDTIFQFARNKIDITLFFLSNALIEIIERPSGK